MTKSYYEKYFYIDLICDVYKTNKPSFISIKIKEDLNEDITPNEVYDYLNSTEDFEKASNSISMSEIFDRDEYEEERNYRMLSYLKYE